MKTVWSKETGHTSHRIGSRNLEIGIAYHSEKDSGVILVHPFLASLAQISMVNGTSTAHPLGDTLTSNIIGVTTVSQHKPTPLSPQATRAVFECGFRLTRK